MSCLLRESVGAKSVEGERHEMAKISAEKKESLLKKMARDSNISLKKLGRENQVGYSTLCGWRQVMRATEQSVSVGGSEPTRDTLKAKVNAEAWPSNRKFLAVVSTLSMNAQEKSEYCRSKGLYVEQLDTWGKICSQANGLSTQASSELREELRETAHKVKELERELFRKEKALAEAAALLVLRKKATAIWEENEED
jgi:hypothetical protein